MKTLSNEDVYKEMADEYRKVIEKFLKSMPKSILTERLIKLKILKQDYVTREFSLNNQKKDIGEFIKKMREYGR